MLVNLEIVVAADVVCLVELVGTWSSGVDVWTMHLNEGKNHFYSPLGIAINS